MDKTITGMDLVLTAAAQADRNNFFCTYPFGENCTCKPKKKCECCKHPGNPKNQINAKYWTNEKNRRNLTGE